MQAKGLVARLGNWWYAGGEPRLSALDLGLIAGLVALLLGRLVCKPFSPSAT